MPEDISAVGYDGIPLAKMMIPSLTTYHQDTQAIGYWAADRLVSLIEHPKTTLPESILIPAACWKEHRSGASDFVIARPNGRLTELYKEENNL